MQALGHSGGFAVQCCCAVLCAVWICLDTFLLRSTCQLCDRLGVDVAPAAVSEGEVELILNRFNLPLVADGKMLVVIAGVFVDPLFSWYNPEFDTEDPPLDAKRRWILFLQLPRFPCPLTKMQVSGHAVPT